MTKMHVSFVIFLQLFVILIFLTVVHGEDTFDCTGYEDDSYHPIYDSDDCRHYWHCIYVDTVYMHAVRRVCPAGTEFDVTLKQCETSGLVDCKPIRSPHKPRTSTIAWRWKYSRLFSRKYWRTTMPNNLFAQHHSIFDIGDATDAEITATMLPEIVTTEKMDVITSTSYPTTTTRMSIEQLSKRLHALILNRIPNKNKSGFAVARLFQPGRPETEIEISSSTEKRRRSKHTTYTTRLTSVQTTIMTTITTQLPSSGAIIMTTETSTTTNTTITTVSTTTAITNNSLTTAETLLETSTSLSSFDMQPDTTMNIYPEGRIGNRDRRNNMTLYILTSDDHKIRQFSINHTRGIIINCNQLRRRLFGRRQLRDTVQTTSNNSSMLKSSSVSSIEIQYYKILSLIILFALFLQK